MSNKKKISYTKGMSYLFIMLFLIMASCKSDDLDDCGCNSQVEKTISKSSNLIAKMFYNNPENSPNDYYENEYWIKYTPANCGNCVHTMIICNTNILGSNFNDLKNLAPGESIDVKFAGYLKELCQLPNAAPADHTHNRITLTKIERQ